MNESSLFIENGSGLIDPILLYIVLEQYEPPYSFIQYDVISVCSSELLAERERYRHIEKKGVDPGGFTTRSIECLHMQGISAGAIYDKAYMVTQTSDSEVGKIIGVYANLALAESYIAGEKALVPHGCDDYYTWGVVEKSIVVK